MSAFDNVQAASAYNASGLSVPAYLIADTVCSRYNSTCGRSTGISGCKTSSFMSGSSSSTSVSSADISWLWLQNHHPPDLPDLRSRSARYSTLLMITSGMVIGFQFILFSFCTVVILRNLWEPWKLPVVTSPKYFWVNGFILLVGYGSSCILAYSPMSILQWILKSNLFPDIISQG